MARTGKPLKRRSSSHASKTRLSEGSLAVGSYYQGFPQHQMAKYEIWWFGIHVKNC